jgi:hypothetical protein
MISFNKIVRQPAKTSRCGGLQTCAKKQSRRAAREVTFAHPINEQTTPIEPNEESKSPADENEYYQTPEKKRSKSNQQVITENIENYAHINN